MRGVSCQPADPGSGSGPTLTLVVNIGLLLALGVHKGMNIVNESDQPDGLKMSAIFVVKIRQIAVNVIGYIFQIEILSKKYCVFILL